MASVEDDLGGTIPTRDDILGQSCCSLLVTACETEIANLERAILVEEQVRWLQVSVDDVGRVHVVASCEDLEHEVLQVIVCQVLPRVDNSMHISLHQLRDNVDVFIARGCRWFGNIQDFDDVLMIEELEQADLSDDTLGINQILESFGNFLDSHLAV